MQVRSKQGKGKFLFEWDPMSNRLEMIVKGMYYLIELNRCGTESSYKIIEEHPKTGHSNNLTI